MGNKSNKCSLAYSQYGIYLSCLAEPNSLRYNIPLLISFSKKIPLDVIRQSVSTTLCAHPSLFNAVYQSGDEVYMATAKEEWSIHENIDLPEGYSLNGIVDQLTQPFRFNGELLIRVYTITTKEKYYIFMDIHHIICDGISLNIIINDLCDSISGYRIKPEEAKFEDFVKEYPVSFIDAYDNSIPTVIELPYGKHSKEDTSEFKVRVFNFSDIDIIRKCKSNKCSPTALLMSALLLTLSKFSNSNSVGIATLNSGREDIKYKTTTGMFVNTFPIVHRFNKGVVRDLINDIRQSYLNGRGLKKYQLNTIKPEILFVYQIGVVDKFYQYNIAGEPVNVELSLKEGLEFKITIWAVERNGNPAIQVKYNTKDYEDNYIADFVKSMIWISEQFIINLDTPLDNVCMVKSDEEASLLSLGKGKELKYDESLTLVDLFTRQVTRTPNNIAAVDANRSYTYREIDELSTKIAVHLNKCFNLRLEEAIGVMSGRSAYMVIYPLAIMKAGCTYVPLDYEHIPDERLEVMCSNAEVHIILTDSSNRVSQYFPSYNGSVCEGIPEATDISINCNITPRSRFVILYTSGSTGTPKGCELEHRGIVNFCQWYSNEFELTQKDRVLAYANFGFDAHMMDIYPALSVGASVYILPEEKRMNLDQMNQYMEDNEISVAFLTTRVGHLFVSEIENRSLRLLSVSGEKLSPLRKPRYKLYNAGAPTECTIYAFFYEITEEYYERPIIGKALSNCQLYVVDESLNLIPKGVAGELLIGGRGVGRGYLGRPDLTAEKFINFKGDRVYRTGDLVKWNDDGLLEYIGRIDNQVKIRGFRIELSEIENKATQIFGIRQVCVDVKEIGTEQKIVCYYVSEDGEDKESLIQGSLKTTLPDYMWPDFYVRLEELQLNANGKVDKKQLPKPEIRTLYAPPTNIVESVICSTFSEILNVKTIGVDDDFSKLGGSSIMALDLLLKLEKHGCEISFTDLMKYRTPRLLSQFLAGDIVDSVRELEYDAISVESLLDAQSFNVNLDDLNHTYKDIYIITGVTGFLGMHIVYELIHTTEQPIICIVRGKDDESCCEYFKQKFNYYFGSYDNSFNDRIVIVNGDLKASSTYKKLEEYINPNIQCTLYNCAANVRHFSVDNQIEQDNITITNNIIDFCVKNEIHLVHMSSISVSGTVNAAERNGKNFTERTLYIGQSLKNEYVRSKYLSEYYILKAIYYKDLNANIMRLGNLGPRFIDGVFQDNISSNAFMNKLKSFWLLTKCPISDYYTTCEISPIDYVAKSIIVLSHFKSNSIIYHPICNNNVQLRDIIKVMNTRRLFVSPTDIGEFNLLKNKVGTADMFSLYAYNQHSQEPTPVNYDLTTFALHRAGFKWPMLDTEYINRFIQFLIDLNFFTSK